VTLGTPRRRLDPNVRREQLVRLGLAQIKARPFDQLLLDEVIDAAGISKGLLFHYFATKRAFLAAVMREAAAELLDATAVDPDLPQLEQLHQGLDAYIGYIEQQPGSYAAIVRGAGSDEELFAIYEDTRSAIADRIAAAVAPTEPPPTVRIAARGWVAMVEESTLMWLREQTCTREQLIEMLEQAAVHVLAAAQAA
jgi:AcrR family transcriptional regulator